MSLTPDQIQQFNARAAAGEGPKHPGWRPTIARPWFNAWRTWELLSFAVVETGDKHSDAPHTFSVVREMQYAEAVDGFTSLPAAQLAAEHLLLQSVKPLVEPELAALRQRAEDADLIAWGLAEGARWNDSTSYYPKAFIVADLGVMSCRVKDGEDFDLPDFPVLTPAAREALRRAKGVEG